MEGYKERMLIELRELDDKICKLSQFVLRESSGVGLLTDDDIMLLVDQMTAMEEYIVILLRRIKLKFNEQEYEDSGVKEILDRYLTAYIKRFVYGIDRE